MDNLTSTPLDAELVPNDANTPPMATQLTPPSSITNGHTSPIGAAYGDGATPTDLNASVTGKGDGKGGWTPGFRSKTAPERALKWERHFTEPGQDAFETIEWEMRTAGITGEDGKSVFEQTNCEVPKPWSQLATNVVVSKYFRGAVNSPERETSVKQVIGRVADTIGIWGAQGGYFATDEDAENFRDELAYLLVHQYGAFNSPVWFNLGVKGARQQASACQPYDALVSTPAGLIPIGELVERNAVGHQVFDAHGVARIVAVKHNGRKEVLRLHLKAGYTLDVTADHLVWKARSDEGGKWVEAGTLKAEDMLAWHRTPVIDKSQELSAEVAEAALAGWLQSDGFVGRYKSGTNRSLTIEAMTVNAAEEKWVRAALDAVFPDAHSHTRGVVTQDEDLDCQRIRIYGDFMESFIEKWDLMKRGNAMTVPPMLYTAPLPVVVAYLRSLFQAEGYVSVRENAVIGLDMVSEGIVRGVQTLLGRMGIYARVRFKADARDDRQGCWSLGIRPRGDRELFASEIGFIAPDKQDKVLQSLLLDGHEASARKTMQIEHIEVRGEMDVYDIQTTSGEYLSNGIRVHNCFINDVYDDMESIMELAATEARLFKGGSGAGVNLWRVRSSKEHLRGGGIASGPISFMRGWDAFAGAVKCLTPDAQVYTDKGVKTVGELISPDLAPGFHADDSIVLATKDGPMPISQVYVSPKSPTRQMELAHTGLRLRGTYQHPVLTLTPQFELEWKALSQIQVGDRVAVARGQEMWPEAAPTFDFEPQTTWAKLDLNYPTQMTPELARLLGYMTSEGCMEAERFRFCNADKDVFADFLRCVEAVFGHDPIRNVSERVNEKTGVTTQMFEACWTNAVRFLQCAGLGFEHSGDKRVPASILSSPRELAVEFLRAYFEGDAHVSTHVCASSASRALLSDVQLLLLNMGMLPLLRPHPVNGKDYWNLYLRGEAAFRFVREIGFISARKQAASDVAGDKNTNIDTLPFLVDVLRGYAAKNGNFQCSDGRTRELGFGFFNRKAGSAISYNRLRNTPALLDQLEQVNPQLAETLEWLMEREFFWDAVKSVEAATPAVTYDFTVPQTHSFVANGIVNHNSGGTTRRAAKMVILNADHPDIGEFITCKADEEKKAWALIEAGYNGGFNVPGGAYDSVDFQNANHSVRVTDEFMRAAENDHQWNLRAVTTGQTLETVSARQMLKDIAQTTWICGDPGMQFDTIINDWHTCSNSDRIYASNPCSEFMFLNSTACVTKETRVSTPEGLRKIADLYTAQQSGEQVYVTTEIAGEHDLRRLSAHRRAFVTQTGEREVFKISLADGRRIRATADHRFLTEGGWKRVDQLKVKGDRLQLRQLGNAVAFTSSEADVKRWQMLGWLTGDGVFSKDNVALVFGPDEAATARAMEDEFNHLISEARAYAGFEQQVAVAVGGERIVPTLPRGGSHVTHQANGVMQINSKSQSLVKYLEEWYGFKQGTAVFKDVPGAVHRVPDDLKVAYLQGLFSADGCIRHDPRGRNARAEEAMLASSSPELLRSVQLILGDLGLTSRIGWTHPGGRTNPQGQLHLYNQQGRNFMALIGFPCSTKKMEYARQITETFFDANVQRPRPATVIAIEPDGIEMVYDLTEPVTHSFIAEGIVTHNCNLASLNLLKFYDMESGVFDAPAYSKACETFLTAQEIIVSFASYPTQKIGEMSEQYRPLGLGYANLGALLMAKGLAYDSDEGRALAGALTAIMTGAGYRKSAQIARNTGPFEGYAANKEPMLRVIAKHRDAVNGIDASLVAENVMNEARKVWDDAYMSGQKYGYRNSQTTVLAPTGCLVAGSLVSTDKGLVRLERLGNPDGAQWQDADFRVYTDGGIQDATKFFINGVEETRVITTQAGYSIQGTGKHRVKVVNAQTGVWEWKHFRDLEAGDLLPLAMNTLIGESQTVTLPPLGQLHWNGEWNTKTPAHMTADLAELVGYFMGDGSLHAKGLRFCVADGDDDVAARLTELGRELFGLKAHLSQQKGYIEVCLNSVSLAHWWDAAGFTKAAPNAQHRGKGTVPCVPDAVLHSNDAHIYGAFLRGLFEADGTNTLGVPSVSSAHKSFADEIRSLMLALGFPTSSKVDTSQWGDSDLHVQRLRNGSYNPRFLNVIGFMGARKMAGVIELKGALSGKGDRVFLPRAVWDELVPCGHPRRNAMVIALKRHGGVARQLAAQIYAQTGDERVAHVLDYFFNEVESNEDGGAQMTYDLSVPGNVTYVANGFVSHNTISFMMDCDTTGVEPDIALVKYKKLVGGGLLKIVNQTVPAALRNLGYDESEIKSIIEYIDKNDTIEGAPGLRDKHLSVFDCAFKAMNGTRSIHHMGHIKMMSATQPFISGAISKCVTGETLVATGKGIMPIGSFYRGEKPGEFTPVAAKLASIGAPQDADLFYYGGNRPTIKASWADGRTIEGTPNHRVKVANASGYDWKRLDALEAGDYVSVKLGANLWADKDANLLDGFEAAALYGCQKTIKLPTKMTPDLARFLGMYIAEGNMTRTNYMVRVTNLNADVLAACERIVFETFGISGRVETDKRNGVTSWVCASKSLCEFLRHIGADGDSSSKQMPWSVLQSSETCVREFIGGLWLDGYVRGDGMTAICLNSPGLLRQLQVVLNNFGLRAQLIRKYNKPYDKFFHELGLHGADSRRFSELFRLDDAHKTEALAKLCEVAKKVDAVHSDVIPAFRAEIQAFIRAKHDTAQFRSVFDPRTKHLSRHTVAAVAAFYGKELFAAIPDLREILDNNIHFVALREIEEGFAPVYDFQVPTNHAFLGNGMINHNTVNMPQDCTADEIYDAYLQSWKMGVKAVAIYRDGSKRTQPLSTSSDAQKAQKIEKKEGEARKALRRKLPDERQAITHKFSIAGQEGYFTVGLYQDGSPGEIFIKMSKEGSTISGLMDSFAVAVSMCLQYGVPLRVLVNKFSHTRFEPSGYTTNRDIPIAKSLMDYIFRWFDLKFQPNGDNGYAGKVIEAATAPAALPEASLFAPSDNHGNVGNAQREVSQMQQDAPPCPDCGALTVRSGACYKCNECGATTGCG